jgi:hypothetical protein
MSPPPLMVGRVDYRTGAPESHSWHRGRKLTISLILSNDMGLYRLSGMEMKNQFHQIKPKMARLF